MNKVKIGTLLMGLLLWGGLSAQAQIGEHRNDFSIGFNGGYVLSSVGFEPEVQQKQHGGMTAGLSMKYTCEKYFKTICSIYAEVNYAKVGWKEDILDIDNKPVIITETKQPMAYSRTINYIQYYRTFVRVGGCYNCRSSWCTCLYWCHCNWWVVI